MSARRPLDGLLGRGPWAKALLTPRGGAGCPLFAPQSAPAEAADLGVEPDQLGADGAFDPVRDRGLGDRARRFGGEALQLGGQSVVQVALISDRSRSASGLGFALQRLSLTLQLGLLGSELLALPGERLPLAFQAHPLLAELLGSAARGGLFQLLPLLLDRVHCCPTVAETLWPRLAYPAETLSSAIACRFSRWLPS